jgi:hypothetical protein
VTEFETVRGRAEDRCKSCRDIGVDCPQGHFTEAKRCDVCGYEFNLHGAGCCPQDVRTSVKCPECDGSIDDFEEDGA